MKRIARTVAATLAGVGLTMHLGGCFSLTGLFAGLHPTTGMGSFSGIFELSPGFTSGDFLSCFNALASGNQVTTFAFIDSVDVEKLCRDPLLVEVPNTVSGVTGTATLGLDTEPLQITGPFACVPTGTSSQICAAAGRSIFVIDGPDGVDLPPGSHTVDIDIDFTVNPPAPVNVRVISAAKVQTTTSTFYPILWPCVDDFSQAIAFTIPLASSPQPLDIDLDGFAACPGGTITLGGAGSLAAPTSSIVSLAAVGLALLVGGGLRLRRRPAA